jgi:hypothetical protein
VVGGGTHSTTHTDRRCTQKSIELLRSRSSHTPTHRTHRQSPPTTLSLTTEPKDRVSSKQHSSLTHDSLISPHLTTTPVAECEPTPSPPPPDTSFWHNVIKSPKGRHGQPARRKSERTPRPSGDLADDQDSSYGGASKTKSTSKRLDFTAVYRLRERGASIARIVSRTRSGAATPPPPRSASGESVDVARTRSGAATPPPSDDSDDAVDVSRTRSGAATPPPRSTSGESVDVDVARTRSGAATPPLRAGSGDSVFSVVRQRSGAASPPPRASGYSSDSVDLVNNDDNEGDEVVFDAGFRACEEVTSPKRSTNSFGIQLRRRKSNVAIRPADDGVAREPSADANEEPKRQSGIASAMARFSLWSSFKKGTSSNKSNTTSHPVVVSTTNSSFADNSTSEDVTTLAVGETFNGLAGDWLDGSQSNNRSLISPEQLIPAGGDADDVE